ncbi:MAG: T9SS type A sorting domain-containing protein [Calditrichaceae bacterium]|nr:T9SS type A sorting domain-containing protein [Calditrichaceae bacterium]
MAKKTIIILLGLLWYLSAQNYEINHNLADLHIKFKDGYHQIDYNGILNLSSLHKDIGYPDLPVYIYKIALGEGITVESFKVHSILSAELKGGYSVALRKKPWRQNLDVDPYDQSGEIKLENVYPEDVIHYIGTNNFGGQFIAHFEIHPVQYYSDSRKLTFIEKINFTVNTKTYKDPYIKPELESVMMFNNTSPSVLSDTHKEVSVLSLNNHTGSLNHIADIENGLIDQYVVITTEELKDSFNRLTNWKIQKGVPAVVRTITWIRQNFPEGIDDAERIRNYIRWTYRKRGTKFVLLGGETELVPTRIITTGGYTFPTDYYYADLDGNWNANSNSIFGEAADNIDGYPEIWVSRIPVETPGDIEIFTDKLLKYETFQDISNPDYPASILYTASNLNRDDDGRDLILNHIDPQINPEFKRTMLTQNDDIGNSHDIPFNALSDNYGLIFSENHGAYHLIKPGSGSSSSIYAYEMNQLTAVDPAVWYMASCSTNDIVKRSVSETYLRSAHGGVAYIGNSSYEYPFSGIYLQKEFFNQIFSQGNNQLAHAHYLSRLPFLGYISWEGPSRIIVFSTIVLGDPEMPVWTEKPKAMLVETNQDDYLEISVKDGIDSSAVENAKVVLYKKNSTHKISYTNSLGEASFNLKEIEPGGITCTITAQNYIPHINNINIPIETGRNLTIIDYDFNQISGNANGLVEPGESFSIDLQMMNSSASPIEGNLSLAVSAPDSLIHFSVDSFDVAVSILPGASLSMDSLAFFVSENFTNDTSCAIPVKIYHNAEYLKTEYVILDIYRPSLVVTDIDWQTTRQGSSYTTELYLQIENTGNGASTNARIALVSDSTVSLSDTGFIFIGDFPPGESEWIPQVFTLTHSVPVEELVISVVVEDQNGFSGEQTIRFNQPDPVSDFGFMPYSSTSIQLQWSSVSTGAVAGYNLFRKEFQQDEFKRINQRIIVKSGCYVDDSLKTNELYQYLIQAVDSSGNVSPLNTDTLTAWPALTRLNGYPKRLSEQAMGSEINGIQVADLDYDGKNELIASGGIGVLNIYDNSGNLLFSHTNLQGMLSLPAIGEVHSSYGKEIIVSSYEEGGVRNNLYIISGEDGHLIHSFNLRYNAPATAVLKDIDHNGFDDIILLTHAGNAPESPKNSRLLIWKSTGNEWDFFDNWNEQGFIFDDNFNLGMPVAADLDHSGVISVIVPAISGKVYAFKPAFSAQPVWSVQLSGLLNTAMSIADADKNGISDILVPALQSDKLYLINYDGSFLPGWENGLDIDITNPWYRGSPGIFGDIDTDKQLEIIYVGRQNIYIIEHNGIMKSGWPIYVDNGNDFFESGNQNLGVYSSPVLADLNQDGSSEIVFITRMGLIHAIDVKTKTKIRGFPLNIHLDIVQGQSPMINDVERDGDLDVLYLGHDGILHIWETGISYIDGTKLYWNQTFANPGHTGELDSLTLISYNSITDNSSTGIPDRFYVKPNYPNPFNPFTTIEYGISAASDIRVEVYNLLGQKIATLFNGKRAAGTYQVRWDGRNGMGGPLSSGIYFYKITIKELSHPGAPFVKSGKMILLK